MKFENEFNGVDALRLAKLIQFVADQGKTISEHTLAGINQSSGNVYLYEEAWGGTPYVFDGAPCWSYFCGECGEEHDFDTLEEIEHYQEEYEQQCEACYK